MYAEIFCLLLFASNMFSWPYHGESVYVTLFNEKSPIDEITVHVLVWRLSVVICSYKSISSVFKVIFQRVENDKRENKNQRKVTRAPRELFKTQSLRGRQFASRLGWVWMCAVRGPVRERPGRTVVLSLFGRIKDFHVWYISFVNNDKGEDNLRAKSTWSYRRKVSFEFFFGSDCCSWPLLNLMFWKIVDETAWQEFKNTIRYSLSCLHWTLPLPCSLLLNSTNPVNVSACFPPPNKRIWIYDF